MCDKNAGIGDAYWFEWSVGLLYAVKMLNPDSKIETVALQSKESNSLDDVVVTYEDGKKEYIQVKNTREYDKLSYSDMIEKKNGKSYLNKFSSDWKELIKKNGQNCRVILFTNREMGNRRYTPSSGWERPPLSSFWGEIKKQLDDPDITDINKITVKKEWENAWKNWKKEMNELTDSEKFLFLQKFDILEDQEDLDKMIDSIADELQKMFKTTHEKAIGLHQKLCYALMKWSTTMREREEINKEDVMEALSISGDEIVGEHVLPLCEPFFKSRINFVSELEKKILNGKSKIIFLTGDPGCGKTNIVSYLSYKAASIVTVRFHAFKPIIPGDLYLSADSGISAPRIFWGNLLIMFRGLFKGRLYENKVPISIEMIDSVDVLREEVIRLAERWAEISGEITVIAIDGIDHAARSGEKNTFLRTLLEPEAIPETVRFLLVGQPVYQFHEYPDFLSDSERIEVIKVPDIQKEDIEMLYDSKADLMKYNQYEKTLIINYILEISKGNTLSAVFSMQEATRYNTFDDFEKNSHVYVLKSGIQLYYEYIWKTALEQAGELEFVIDMYITAVFSIINRKVSAQVMKDIFDDSGIEKYKWENILQSLFPIIDCDEWGYSVFHNDVRVFLATHYKKGQKLVPIISGKIADFLLKDHFDGKIKHEIVFQLLKDSNREKEYVDVFTCQYVREAIVLKRSFAELKLQMEKTLESLIYIEDRKKIINFSCAVSTIVQYKWSLDCSNRQYKCDIKIPLALESEKKTVPEVMFTIEQIKTIFSDIDLLVNNGEIDRAKHILERWLNNKSPEIFNKFVEKQEYAQNELYYRILRTWGKYARKLHVSCRKDKDINENEQEIFAQFSKGWLKEAKNYQGIDQIEYTLRNISCCYKQDLEEYFQNIIENESIENVTYILSGKVRNSFSKLNQITACVWGIKNNRKDLCIDWIETIKNKKFKFISEKDIDKENSKNGRKREKFKLIANIMYILSCETDDSSSILLEKALNEIDFKESKYDFNVANYILRSILCVAEIEQCCYEDRIDEINLEGFEYVLDILLNRHYYDRCIAIETLSLRKEVLESFINISNKLSEDLQKILLKKICLKAKKYDEIILFKSYWKYLSIHSKDGLLEDYFNAWMDKNGKIWEQELSERDFIADILINIAEKMNWDEKVEQAHQILNDRSIGYIGHKEYSLFTPLNWFKRISEKYCDIWKEEGVLLMNISEYASQIGDNRAGIQIPGVIAGVAGKMGIENLFQFVNMIQHSEFRLKEIVFDGVISAMETENIREEELLEIWQCAVDYFWIDESADRYDTENMKKKIYIADIHKAISLCAARMKYDEIEKRMEEIAPVEYRQERLKKEDHNFIISHRWYDSEYYVEVDKYIKDNGKVDFDEMFSNIESWYGQEQFSWDYIKYFLEQAKKKAPEYINKYKPKVIEMLEKRNVNMTLEYDGSNRLYEELFQYMEEDEITDVLKKIIDTYHYCDNAGWSSTEFGLMRDLEHFTYALFSRYDIKDNLWALKEILKMHCIWLNGSETFEMDNLYKLKNENVEVTDWIDFCKKIKNLLI